MAMRRTATAEAEPTKKTAPAPPGASKPHLQVFLVQTAGVPRTTAYTVEIDQLQMCMCEGNFPPTDDLFDGWRLHLSHQPETIVTAVWGGDDRRLLSDAESSARFRRFALALGLGLAHKVLEPGEHEDAWSLEQQLTGLLDFVQLTLDPAHGGDVDKIFPFVPARAQLPGMLQLVLMKTD